MVGLASRALDYSLRQVVILPGTGCYIAVWSPWSRYHGMNLNAASEQALPRPLGRCSYCTCCCAVLHAGCALWHLVKSLPAVLTLHLLALRCAGVCRAHPF